MSNTAPKTKKIMFLYEAYEKRDRSCSLTTDFYDFLIKNRT